MSVLHALRNKHSQLEIFEDRVEITSGAGAAVIPFSSMTSIQFKGYGSSLRGHLHFSINVGLDGRVNSIFPDSKFYFTVMAKDENSPAKQIEHIINSKINEFSGKHILGKVLVGNSIDSIKSRDEELTHILYTIANSRGQIEVFKDRVEVTSRSMLGLFKSFGGATIIPFSSITAVQFKELGVFLGHIHFSIHGGLDSKSADDIPTDDKYTFWIITKEENILAREIKDFIESKKKSINTPPATQAPSATSLSDELLKLAKLRDQGILSDEEFQSAKKSLLN